MGMYKVFLVGGFREDLGAINGQPADKSIAVNAFLQQPGTILQFLKDKPSNLNPETLV